VGPGFRIVGAPPVRVVIGGPSSPGGRDDLRGRAHGPHSKGVHQARAGGWRFTSPRFSGVLPVKAGCARWSRGPGGRRCDGSENGLAQHSCCPGARAGLAQVARAPLRKAGAGAGAGGTRVHLVVPAPPPPRAGALRSAARSDERARDRPYGGARFIARGGPSGYCQGSDCPNRKTSPDRCLRITGPLCSGQLRTS